MRTLVLLLAIFTTGCGQHVYRTHLASIEKLCKDHGGWADIDATRGCIDARCVDGTHVSCSQVSAP